MKKLFVTLVLALAILSSGYSQSQYEIIPDQSEGKILKGIISRDLIQKDTSFKWYATGLNGYAPNQDALNGLKKHRDSIQLLVFMGTWCEDSHYIIPKFFTLLDAAGFPSDRVSLIGVDRSKKTLSHLTEAMGIINVPTIMVMKNGKEMGRVVEYGKSGLFDKDMAEILNSIGTTAR